MLMSFTACILPDAISFAEQSTHTHSYDKILYMKMYIYKQIGYNILI